MECRFLRTKPAAGDLYYLSFSDREKRQATRRELDLIEPRLASAIKDFSAIEDPDSIPELVDATLRYWVCPRIELPRYGRGHRVYLSRIHTIEITNNGEIDFFADNFSMRKNRSGVPVAATLGRNNTWTLSVSDLEDQYQGGVDRLRVSIAIGMGVEDLVRQITSDGKELELGSVALPDMA